MAPNPKDCRQQETQADPIGDPISDDDVVISGIAGLFPNCDNVQEFAERLYNKENMVLNQQRWNLRNPELTEHHGFMRHMEDFDAQFFSVFASLAHNLDPLFRRLCEHVYEAIFDAGLNMCELDRQNVGVYAATTRQLESFSYNSNIVGQASCMAANRISYYLNTTGPSMTVDSNNLSSITVLEQGYQAIKNGYCKAAIVGNSKNVLYPQVNIMDGRVMQLNKDGKSKCYDTGADGHSISESVNVIFLQKYKDAKRVYAVLKHVLTGMGSSSHRPYREPAPFPRSAPILGRFFNQFYEEAGVPPSQVKYIEGYGAADLETDKIELQAMEQVFCPEGRKEPLLVGTAASNVGFTGGVCSSISIMKLIFGYQRGELAATIHCENPRQDVVALREGRMRIVTDNTPFDRSYTAVTALSLTGGHGHVLLHGFRKPKDLSKYQTNIPYLITVSGRKESAVSKILDDISRQLDAEEIALVHNVFKAPIKNHLARGFGIYSKNGRETVSHCQRVEHFDDMRRPLWFVYSGMGSQWVGMGKHLMHIPAFAASIIRCHKILEPHGIDLINIITTDDKTVFNNILHSFVGITAIQVALTDILTSIGLVPDNMVGHSFGELGCAYADGCFTVEQVMMLSYVRGYVSTNSKVEHGTMAAVGLGFQQLSKICPPEIDIACHNNSTSTTISGPSETVRKFVEQLKSGGIFTKEVESSNVAYHSRYIATLGPKFLKMSRDVVREPKLRSERWVSSSVPMEKQSDYNAMYSSAEYHTNNLLNAVLFEEALRSIPANAVLVEVAPHCLLQAILKRALPSCQLVSITRRMHSDSTLCLLEGIGSLFMAGYTPDISQLYPKVEFPVSSPTRTLSHLVEWIHTDNWNLWSYADPKRRFCSVYKQIVAIVDDEYKYLAGHHIEGTRVIPFAACLMAAWDTLAMVQERERRKMSVKFRDLKFHCQPLLTDSEPTYLTATVHRGSGDFQVFDGNTILVEGNINITAERNRKPEQNVVKDKQMYLNKDAVYKLLFERGYDYKDQFRSIHSMDPSMMHGLIDWQDNWVTFIDAILQTYVLRTKHDWVSQPIAVKRLVIDIKRNTLELLNSNLFPVTYDEVQGRTRCGGVTVEHVLLKNKVPPRRQTVALQTLKFMPFNQKDNTDISTAISNVMQIVAEDVNTDKVTVYIVDLPKMQNYINKIKKTMGTLPNIHVNIIDVKQKDMFECKAMMGKPDAVFMHDLLSDKKMFEVLYHILPSNTYLISVGLDANNTFPSAIYNKISSIGSGGARVELARFKPTPTPSTTICVTVRNMSDMHQLRTTCELLPYQNKLLVLAPIPPPSELKEQVKFWRKDSHKNVSMVMFDQNNAMDKELENIPELAFSVLHEGTWGGEYYVPTKLESASLNSMVSLTCTRPGDLDSLTWVEVDEPTNKGIEVMVHYAGLVGYDASRAQGEGLSSVEGGFGMDFSGVTSSGERVMGLMARGSASSKVRADPRMLWPVPAHWTMEDAATVPFAYCYALYILSRICNPERGMSILVHGASGALGQALISVSLAYGLEVFATVSDMHKKRFLKKLFPELKDDHIGNSRDATFKDMVKRGKPSSDSGADIVVSCAKGPLKSVAIGSCGLFGYAIDTTQLVTRENYVYGMMCMVGGRSYRTIDFSGKLTEDNDIELRWLQLMLSEGIKKGYVRPLSRVIYAPHETSRAFRLLAGSRHRGRVLLSLKESAPHTLPRISCHPASSYVVICEDEDFSLQFVDLLVRRGARKLHLHGRDTSYLRFKMQQWKELGVHVEVSSANLSKKTESLNMLLQSGSLGVVDGIYMIATNPRQNLQASATICANLDLTSRKVCPELRYFAVISDRIWREVVYERTRDGLHALSLKLPKLRRLETTGDDCEGLPMNVVIEAVERALLSGDHVVAAQALPLESSSVLEEVAKIPGVNITNAMVDRITLEQVGVDHGRVRELCNLLQEKFNITVTPEKVPNMTIGQLKQLNRDTICLEKDLPGFEPYVTIIDDDELRATTEVVFLNTLVHRTPLRNDEMPVTPDTLCIIPGLEGHYARFRAVCERLKVPALVFQLGHDHLQDSLQETAQRLANSIMRFAAPQNFFHLLGYEFGVMLSLEVAAILESYGMTGTVFLVGGTPEDIRSSFNARWRGVSEAGIQNALLKHIHHVICHSNSPELEELLHKLTAWPEKVAAVVKILLKKVPRSIEFLTGIINGLYSRIQLLQSYDAPSYKLRSKIVLLQCKPHTSSAQSLQSLTSQELVVKNLESTLAFVLKDLNCSYFINNYLNEDTLEKYNNSNHCNTMLINDNEFTSLHNKKEGS